MRMIIWELVCGCMFSLPQEVGWCSGLLLFGMAHQPQASFGVVWWIFMVDSEVGTGTSWTLQAFGHRHTVRKLLWFQFGKLFIVRKLEMWYKLHGATSCIRWWHQMTSNFFGKTSTANQLLIFDTPLQELAVVSKKTCRKGGPKADFAGANQTIWPSKLWVC